METIGVVVIIAAAAAGVGYVLYRGATGKGGCANCSGKCHGRGTQPGGCDCGCGDDAECEGHGLSGKKKS